MNAADTMCSHKRIELNPAAVMFALGRNEKRNYIISLTVALCEPVEAAFLQAALEKAVQKYPYFFIQIIKRGNQLFAEPIKGLPKVKEKASLNCLQIQCGEQNCEAQVTYFENTIILEYFHAISDGKGGIEFLLLLTAEYLSLKYCDESIVNSISASPLQEQITNGYRICATGLATAKKSGIAYKIRDTQESGSLVNGTIFRLSTTQIRRLSKEQKVSVTEYIAALLCMGIWNIQQESSNNRGHKKIRLTVPVNLRTRFPCHTLQNFSLNVYPEIDPTIDRFQLSDICGKIQQYMKTALDPKRLAGRCGLCNLAANSPVINVLPLHLKKRIVQSVLDFPLTGSSLTFSNLGSVFLPPTMRAFVTDIGVVFSPKPESPYSCTLISLEDTMNLSFLRTIKLPLLEKELEQLFYQFNISYKKTVVGANKEVGANGRVFG